MNELFVALIAAILLLGIIGYRIYTRKKTSVKGLTPKNPVDLLEIQETERLKAAMRSIRSGILATDKLGNITFINPYAEEITGFGKQESLGKSFKAIFRPAEDEEGTQNILTINAMLSGDKLQAAPCKINLIAKDGTVKHVFSSVTVITNDNHETAGILIIIQDITEESHSTLFPEESQAVLDIQDVLSEPVSGMELAASASGLDSLTQLPIRQQFYEVLEQWLQEAVRDQKDLALLFVDLDLFKNINDTLGHNIGDALLCEASERLVKAAGPGTYAARMGGDEFAVLISGYTSKESPIDIALSILNAISAPFSIEGNALYVSASIGIAMYPEHGDEYQALLKNAASAMYKVKELGRNNYQIYSKEIHENILQKFNMQKSLRRAIEQNELILHYQPKVDGKTGELTGMEALVRWQHPEKGLVYPAEFIPLAEETGLIKVLDEWVLKTACSQLKFWKDHGHKNLRLAVNLSAWQFKEQHLPVIVANVLSQAGLDPSCLELEITETVAMENLNFTVNTLSRLMEMGVNISIDDFGTGYSSLNYLKHFPINYLKVDRTFIADILEDKNTYAIVKAIIEVAHTLNLKVIAEGVETKEQLTVLKYMGCDEIQGYYISKPLPVDEAERHMAGRK